MFTLHDKRRRACACRRCRPFFNFPRLDQVTRTRFSPNILPSKCFVEPSADGPSAQVRGRQQNARVHILDRGQGVESPRAVIVEHVGQQPRSAGPRGGVRGHQDVAGDRDAAPGQVVGTVALRVSQCVRGHGHTGGSSAPGAGKARPGRVRRGACTSGLRSVCRRTTRPPIRSSSTPTARCRSTSATPGPSSSACLPSRLSARQDGQDGRDALVRAVQADRYATGCRVGRSGRGPRGLTAPRASRTGQGVSHAWPGRTGLAHLPSIRPTAVTCVFLGPSAPGTGRGGSTHVTYNSHLVVV